MELAFSKNTLDCLQRVAWEVKQAEQTQEVKIPDAMPDIGTVLGAWGQPVIRGKNWHGSGMSVTGGITAWVLYVPEDGTMPRVVETWLPWQLHWDFSQTQRDGSMLVRTLVQDLDARSVSPRKLMLRAVVSAAGEALEPVKLEQYLPQDLPEDVYVLRKSYPVMLPREAGEKTFTLEEDLQLPQSCADARKLLYYCLHPEITERKIMADKIVFRGMARIHGLCRCGDDHLQPFSLEIPFSQYGELERQYDDSADAQIIPEVSDVELDLAENGGLRLKAGIVGQYMVCDRPVLEIIEDAYSPAREVTPRFEQMELPVILEQRTDLMGAEQTVQADAESVLDVAFRIAHPKQMRMGESVQLQQPGEFQLLYLDPEGAVKTTGASWEGQLDMPAAPQTKLLSTARFRGMPGASRMPGQVNMSADVAVDTMAVTTQNIPMITGLELGDAITPDPGRPSLILRKVGRDSLWQIAKQSGSTVDAIRKANSLEQEPDADSILLIPVS